MDVHSNKGALLISSFDLGLNHEVLNFKDEQVVGLEGVPKFAGFLEESPLTRIDSQWIPVFRLYDSGGRPR